MQRASAVLLNRDRSSDLLILQSNRSDEVCVMNTNVVNLRKIRAKPSPMEISEFSLPVGDEVYTVRRAVERDTQAGFVTIYDSDCRAVLVFPSRYPDEHIAQLIVGWRAGYSRGLERGQGRVVSRRWPNTAHWQRVEAAFRETDGSRWRTAAAIAFGCTKSGLRSIVDHEMTADEIKALDAQLIDHLHRHAEELNERAEHVYNASRAVMRSSNEVSVNTCIETPIIFDPDTPPFDPATAHFEPWQAIIREILMEDA
jgi:hypothetical protein